MGFDPEFPVALDDRLRVSTWRAHHLLALEQCDVAIAPTQWQKSQFPATYQPKIQVLHEGIATDVLGPDPQAQFTLPNGQVLKAGDSVVTYVARNLEPYRGFHVFIRSLPALLAAHPTCQVLIVGGDEVSYGRAPKSAKSWREALLREVNIDTSSETGRVHFLGKLPYAQYRRVLQVSAVHVYLTYPFVLSWSLLEALASGCAVVASDTAPVREVIRQGQNGWLVEFFDGAQLVKAVHKVLTDSTGMQVMRRAAMESVKERFAQAAGTAGYLDALGLRAGPTATAKPINEISAEET
jgi:hypothetical protein